MSVEIVAKGMLDAAQKSAKEGVNLVKKVWSIMDAASEKKTPQEYLSSEAIKSIQGK